MILFTINANLNVKRIIRISMIIIWFNDTSQFKGSEAENHIKTFGAKGNIFSEGVNTLFSFFFGSSYFNNITYDTCSKIYDLYLF